MRAALYGGGSVVALALGSSLNTAGAASAEAEEDALDAVVVTGYRASLQSAVATKRREDNIVDVIKADDLASFPDANLAESIQRIPGVSVTRDAGEGRTITVRGLGGDFVRTTLNGIEAYSATTGSTLGVDVGINRTRGFDFSTFASELFNSVSVYKSQSAEMDEGSLAATVNLETARPFDKPGFRAAASAQSAYYDNNKTAAPRLSGLISNTWGNFGALFSVAYSTRLAQEDGYSDTSQSDYSDFNNGFCGRATDDPAQPGSQVVNTRIPYVNELSGSLTGLGRPANQCFSGDPSDPVAYSAINQAGIFLPRNPGLGRFQLDQERLGATTSFQWRPSDATRLTLDAVYSQFDQDRTDYALSNASNNRNVNGASSSFPLFAGRVDSQIMDVHIVPTGVDPSLVGRYGAGQVDYMRLNNVDVKHIQERTVSTTKTHQIGLRLEQDFTDRLSGEFKVGHSGSAYDQPYTILMSYDGFNKDNYIWDSRASARRPFISYGYDVANPANVTFTNLNTGLTPDIRITQATVDNTLKTGEANLKFDLGDGWTLKGGLSYKGFEFESLSTTRRHGNNGPRCAISATNRNAAATQGTPCPAGTYTTFDFGKFAADFPGSAPLSTTLAGWGSHLGLPADSVTGWVVPDVDAYIRALDLLCNCANAYGDFTLAIDSALANNRGVRENDKAFYLQADFDNEVLGGRRIRGNVGVRYVKTNLTASGFLSLTAPVVVKNSYDDLLPSLNVALDVTPDLVARLAYASVMARPGFNNLNPGGGVNTTFGAQNATIGNPFLKPYRAKNYDLSLEWYPTPGSIISAAFFYKDIASLIQNITSVEPYGTLGLPLSLLPSGQDGTTPYTVTRSRNAQGGYVKGVELNLQQDFTFLPGIFSNFGTLLNYTYVDSSIPYFLSTTNPTPVYDQFARVSPHSVNATLYYEDKKFSARVSASYRDEYIVTLPFKAEVPDAYGSYATLNVDMSASYQLTPNVKFTFDALNLTDQAADQWSGQVRRSQRVYSKTGRQFFAGVSFTL
ncbi:MAG: TonB-dependent receptor [Steroidobacteraceae bacterium]